MIDRVIRLPVTLDASTWVAAQRVDEPSHDAAARVIDLLLRHGTPLVQHTLFPVEVTAAMRRRTGSPTRAEWALRQVIDLDTMTLLPINEAMAVEAAQLAASVGVRGADACYVATARLAHTTLITLDVDLIRRTSTIADIVTPAEWLTRILYKGPLDPVA